MVKVSNYKSGAIYKTAQGLYVYKENDEESEGFDTITQLVASLKVYENNKVSKTSGRSNGDNSESQAPKKPRKKSPRKTK